MGDQNKRRKEPASWENESLSSNVSSMGASSRGSGRNDGTAMTCQLAMKTPFNMLYLQFKIGFSGSGEFSHKNLVATPCKYFRQPSDLLCKKGCMDGPICRYLHACYSDQPADNLCFDEDSVSADRIFEILNAEYRKIEPKLRESLNGNLFVESCEFQCVQYYAAVFICPVSGCKFFCPRNEMADCPKKYGSYWHKTAQEARRAVAWHAWDSMVKYGPSEPHLGDSCRSSVVKFHNHPWSPKKK